METGNGKVWGILFENSEDLSLRPTASFQLVMCIRLAVTALSRVSFF